MPAWRSLGCELRPVRFFINGEEAKGAEGDTVAAALIVSRGWTVRTARNGEPRGPFCLIGVCQECLAEIDGVPNRRTCMQTIAPDMRVLCR